MSYDIIPEREQKVLDFIRDYPGVSKETVIKEMEKKQISSRVTTHKIILQFIKEKKINAFKEKTNSQLHRLYINQDNTVLLMLQGLRNFERACFVYFRQLDDKYQAILKKGSTKEKDAMEQLLYNTGLVIDKILTHYFQISRREWHQIVKDKSSLRQLYANFFLQLAEFQMKLSNYNGPAPLMAGLKEYDRVLWWPAPMGDVANELELLDEFMAFGEAAQFDALKNKEQRGITPS